jgi:hypothetical protein
MNKETYLGSAHRGACQAKWDPWWDRWKTDHGVTRSGRTRDAISCGFPHRGETANTSATSEVEPDSSSALAVTSTFGLTLSSCPQAGDELVVACEVGKYFIANCGASRKKRRTWIRTPLPFTSPTEYWPTFRFVFHIRVVTRQTLLLECNASLYCQSSLLLPITGGKPWMWADKVTLSAPCDVSNVTHNLGAVYHMWHVEAGTCHIVHSLFVVIKKRSTEMLPASSTVSPAALTSQFPYSVPIILW